MATDLLADALPPSATHSSGGRSLGRALFFMVPLANMGRKMQVNVFMLRAGNDSRPTLLLLPDDRAHMVIPRHLRPWGWQYFMTTVSGDDLIGGSSWVVDELLRRDGYLLVQAATSANS